MERYGAIPTKVFVVMEIGWEYNDENYYRAESEGGTPKVAYISKEDAEVRCAEMNAKGLEHNNDMMVEWGGVEPTPDNPDGNVYVTELYEVKEVVLVDE